MQQDYGHAVGLARGHHVHVGDAYILAVELPMQEADGVGVLNLFEIDGHRAPLGGRSCRRS